jgi:tetratricopeptide (TPR) repeat protein
LSDRKGNLAIILLEEDKFADAFEILEDLLVKDKEAQYVKGCVVKQGTLGQYYLRQGELQSAERIFKSSLAFIRRQDESFFNAEWNKEVKFSHSL